MKNAVYIKALSHDISIIFSTFPLLPRPIVTGTRRGRQLNAKTGAIAARDVHIVTLARYDDGYQAM